MTPVGLRVWNVAHRGASADAPENTLAAFELAIEQGADIVEADVRLTADGEPLVLHDATVDRTTTGTGPLRALTAEAASELDAGDGERIPALAEVLALARGRVRVNLDIKEVDAVDAAIEAVQALGMAGQVNYISFLPEACDLVADRAPESPVVQLVDSAAALAQVAMGKQSAPPGVSGFGVPHELVTPELAEHLHRQGLGLFAWTVDDQEEMRRLLACGVNAIVTNRPGVLAALLRASTPSPDRAA